MTEALFVKSVNSDVKSIKVIRDSILHSQCPVCVAPPDGDCLPILDCRAYRVSELIPILGSQPAGDVSHKPGGAVPVLFARPAVTLKRAATNFTAW